MSGLGVALPCPVSSCLHFCKQVRDSANAQGYQGRPQVHRRARLLLRAGAQACGPCGRASRARESREARAQCAPLSGFLP